MSTRRYSELIKRTTFEERFRYLALRGSVGAATFGFDRPLNQKFYQSREWKQLRWHIIDRDMNCDLGVEDHEIFGRPVIHHMNPMTADEIVQGDEGILDPDFLITTTHKTHNAIHYGDERHLPRPFVPRRPGDTDLWRRRAR